MVGVRKLEHAELRVPDVERSTSFFTEVMGLIELERNEDTIYLGCGYDSHFDLAVAPGERGVEHVAVRVNTEREFEMMANRLEDADEPFDRLENADPGEEVALRFSLPSGVNIELVRMSSAEYSHPAYPVRDGAPGHAPLDLDHVNLSSSRVEMDATFLRDVLGFRLSDVRYSGETWLQAFTRLGDHHHDIALTFSEDSDHTLHHIAWDVASIEEIRMFADRLASTDTKLEMGGIGRHQAGGCLFAYFHEPGGNRFEFCANMSTLDDDTEVTFRDADAEKSSISAWGELPVPASFKEGS